MYQPTGGDTFQPWGCIKEVQSIFKMVRKSILGIRVNNEE